ncbi:hypothetical protein FEM48_Zijuj11G0121100 [Ziziphus jujuba var. spinosa]|uniref:Peroxidase n=1 Tax=Ziziphus jujuba var. spinosa TaxID=714518 RepID=A0A978UIU5_ZIZJJ|nr:hypothetical protein FEM48_Zijuj11G0121100 [Ziziphus jujuba var. spinosa]
MAWRGFPNVVLIILMSLSSITKTTCSSSSILSPNFYDQSCPCALPAIKLVVEDAVQKEPRMAASLLRLHFHDCFVNGCDGSLLLDTTDTIDSEKNSAANRNSTRGFNVVDDIKREVDTCCGGAVVSCADILAVAARDSVGAVGGPTWEVQLGRRDATTASKTAADANIPPSFLDLPALIDNFKNHGLDEKDLVLLSAAHNLGFAQCLFFKNRIYNETDIDPAFAEHLKSACPINGGDSNLSPLDPSPASFDRSYLTNLVQHRGLLHSDQALFSGGYTDELVKIYSIDDMAFRSDFAQSMIKMGNIQPLTGDEGEIRRDCRKVNH